MCVYSFLGIRLQVYPNSDLLQISVIIYEFGHGVLKSDVFVGLYKHYLGDVLRVQSFLKKNYPIFDFVRLKGVLLSINMDIIDKLELQVEKNIKTFGGNINEPC